LVGAAKLIGFSLGQGRSADVYRKRAELFEVQGRASGGPHPTTFRFGIGKASVKPLKLEVMTRTRIQLTAVWGNDDAQSSVLVSRRRWTAIQNGAEYTVNSSSSYEGKRYKVVWRFADRQVSIDGEDGMECVVGLPLSELVSTDPSATASSKA
jgi:hypothetical protein